MSCVAGEACENTLKLVDELQGQSPMLQAIHVPPDIFPNDAAAVGLGKRGPRLANSYSAAVRAWILDSKLAAFDILAIRSL